jgi:O-antigen/teichoic acid export membrane protein/quinol monooxygenase YgiN
LENFLLNVYVARSLGVAGLGAFSLAYVTYGLANNANRGLAIEPLLVRFSAAGPRVWRRAARGSVSTSLLVGIVLGLCALAAGAVIGGTTGLAFYGLGLVFPFVLLQDAWRYAFFSWGRGYHALINDTIWLFVQVPLMIFLKSTGHANVFWFVIAWGAGAFVGSIVGSFQAKVIPNLRTVKQWLVKHHDLGLRFLAENTGANASTTLQSYAISYILGIVAVGSIRAAGVLMGPLNIMFYGIGMLTVPEGARILRKSPRRLPLYCVALSAGLTLLTLAWTVLLLVGLPHGIGNLMLGSVWRHTYPLVLPTAAFTVAGALGIGAGVGLHALGAARRSMRATLIGSVLILAFSLLGAVIAGVVGTLYFGAAGAAIGTLISWWQFRKALHEPDHVRDSHRSGRNGDRPENGDQRPNAQASLPGAGHGSQGTASARHRGADYQHPVYGQRRSTDAPRPYGRLSMFTLLDDKIAEFDRLAERAAEGVRTTEPDTLVYIINVVPRAPMQRIIYEIYRDRTAFESHEQQPHIQRFAEDRRSCVQTVNVIDLRLEYAKVATLGASAVPQDSRSSQGTQTTRVSQAMEPSTYASSGADGFGGGSTPGGGRAFGSGRTRPAGPPESPTREGLRVRAYRQARSAKSRLER